MVTMESLIVGKSRRMQEIFEFLRVIGPSESTVLITGESGTGKEVTATLIHQNSRRRHRPFVAVSCALALVPQDSAWILLVEISR